MNIESFSVKNDYEYAFVQMLDLKEKQDAKLVGLIRYQILKDCNSLYKYWLYEYWESKEKQDSFISTRGFIEFNQLLLNMCNQNESFIESKILIEG